MSIPTDARQAGEIVIEPTRGSLGGSLRDVAAYSALWRFLVSRELKSRYRPTNLGRLWIFLRPLLEMLTYVAIFGYVLGVRSTHLPYPLHIYSGLVVWILFSGVVSANATSLASNRHLMSKVYFPRLIVPLVTLGLAVMDFLVAGSLLLVMMLVYGVLPGVQLLALPLFLLLLVALTLGVGLVVAASSVDTADLAIALPVVLRILMYASPVTYPLDMVPAALRDAYLLNPLTALLEGVRWSLFGTPWPGTLPLAAAGGVALAVLLFGLSKFRATERRLVDFL